MKGTSEKGYTKIYSTALFAAQASVFEKQCERRVLNFSDSGVLLL